MKGKPQYCFIEAVEDLAKIRSCQFYSVTLVLMLSGKRTGTGHMAPVQRNWTLRIWHLVTLSSDEDAHETFQWVDTLMSNLKAFIDGTYHGRERFKQLYTAEFTYRLNRRHMGHRLVEQLLNICALTHPINVRQTA